METGHQKSAGFKERAIEEFKIYWVIVLYLWIFLGSFTVYRRLVIAEAGGAYLNYGFALIEAMIIAKVILIGKIFAFTRRFDDRPLIVPILFKAVLFGLFVLLFGLIEHLVGGWIHHKGLLGGLAAISEIGAYELAARVLMMIVAFIPFFAFSEIGRVLGPGRLVALIFSQRRPG
jgi:hypothetical protein